MDSLATSGLLSPSPMFRWLVRHPARLTLLGVTGVPTGPGWGRPQPPKASAKKSFIAL